MSNVLIKSYTWESFVFIFTHLSYRKHSNLVWYFLSQGVRMFLSIDTINVLTLFFWISYKGVE